MKKYILHFVHSTFIKVALLTVCSTLFAQVSDPSTWNSFVNSPANALVSDTFRLQTFGDSEWDNWEYTTSGKTNILDFSTLNLDNLGGKWGLKISLGASISLQPYSLLQYNNVIIQTYYGGRYLNKNDNFFYRIYRPTETIEFKHSNITEDNTSYSYRPTNIANTPYALDIFTSTSNNTKGYFGLQYAFACGNIPEYSLFTGTGNWNDTLRWSHLPAMRHRNALIDGEVTISSTMYCNNISLNKKGKIRLMPGSSCIINNLDLYDTDLSILSEGNLTINGSITLHKTFNETANWYFISFPFDVYPDGIDSRFEQKDATPNNGGNYFYVQTYNGDKRAFNNQASGNWDVLPVQSGNSPLFEKNKGYLIALDEKATIQTLTFSSQPGTTNSDFAKNSSIPVELKASPTAQNTDNYGWYLCGNPLPSPFSFSQIEKNSALDGNIYVYSNTGYTSYSLQSDYAIPPFSYFFIKASESTEINISTSPFLDDVQLLQLPSCLNITREPNFKDFISNSTTTISKIQYQVKDGTLHLENIIEPGFIQLIDLTGHCILSFPICKGSHSFPLPSKKGLFILQIQTKSHKQREKLLLF